jgi:hypothetical protein
MPPMKTRVSLLPAVLGLVMLASCSSSSAPPPTAYIASTLGTSTTEPMATESCTIQEPGAPFLPIGSLSSLVPNEGVYEGNEVLIACQVSATGGGFEVNLEVNVNSVGGIAVSGMLTDTTGAQPGITASFTTTNGLSGDTYSSSDCTFTLSTAGNPPITAGRVWGTLDCPTMTNMGAGGATCDGTATLLFENCSE